MEKFAEASDVNPLRKTAKREQSRPTEKHENYSCKRCHSAEPPAPSGIHILSQLSSRATTADNTRPLGDLLYLN